MDTKEIKIIVNTYSSDAELAVNDANLINEARIAAKTAYAPYSNFMVGAAVLLSNGEIIRGSNQENAASPAGTCAERSALNWIGANCSNFYIKCIAITAVNSNGERASSLSPCGICRQALVEFQNRQNKPIKVLIDTKNEILEVADALDLVPLAFKASSLNI